MINNRIPYTVLAIALLGAVQPALATDDATTEAPPLAEKPVPESTIIRIYESAPPKPIGQVPQGWELAVVQGRKIEHPPIELPNGKQTRLTSLAYILVPQEGRVSFTDPGFDPELGTAQKDTVGASLTSFIESSQSIIATLNAAESMILEQFGEVKPEEPQPSPAKKKK